MGKNNTTEQVEFLSRAYRLREYIMMKEEQLETLREAAESVSASSFDRSGSASYGSGSRHERILCKVMDLEEEIVGDIGRMINTIKQVKDAIAKVEDKTMRMLLEMRYLNYKTWEEISEVLCYSERHVYRLHTEAVKLVPIGEDKVDHAKEKTCAKIG